MKEKLPLMKEKIPLMKEKIPLMKEKIPLMKEKIPLMKEKIPLMKEKIPLMKEKILLMKEKNRGQKINCFVFENGLFSKTIQVKIILHVTVNLFNFVCIVLIHPYIIIKVVPSALLVMYNLLLSIMENR